ncbi:Hypothetical predicted protein, partial [Pelobates cultripes]
EGHTSSGSLGGHHGGGKLGIVPWTQYVSPRMPAAAVQKAKLWSGIRPSLPASTSAAPMNEGALALPVINSWMADLAIPVTIT